MTTSLPPDLLAVLDRAGAELADLVRLVREHLADCEVPHVAACPGPCAAARIERLPERRRKALLLLALCALAQKPATTHPR